LEAVNCLWLVFGAPAVLGSHTRHLVHRQYDSGPKKVEALFLFQYVVFSDAETAVTNDE
jgi:hypothetical protein